ncbi:type III secretion protein [Rhodovulum sp. BSW8]|uniref:Flagellar biosynthetic protein FliR n=1 Tax=Rhodovulum visakhapatnamense TaxID=364297 RepID=A0ABS1RFT9_9RHOB|nr:MULTISPECIES: flagellar biosynthetic protein FliR [Rhodovulum]MBL3568954.1 flagellar biosynthetic protein FliR [Rhodovulum visakhapatnamense]MBL3578115.1 flagellar biosynthetic protein FliR [Rhodovulum visakhapatnamense]OLS43652.1 flagellar biosynthesis protein FliR [Rhodovulum sulfidophilum]RBO51195.1 type III secretion protein [Rhodovulum sp. BSW8]
MTLELAPALEIWRPLAIAAFLVFLRVGAIMAMLPAFGERAVPTRVRLGLALAFTAVVAPAVAPRLIEAPPSLAVSFATETVIGLALGLVLRMMILALQMAGEIAAQATSLSQILGAASMDPQPAMGRLMLMAGLTLAVMSGLHVRAAEAMILSYDLLPAGRFPDAATLADWGTGSIAKGFALAATLAMPFVIASLIYNLALGVINKAMPQLMVAFVGAPAITAGGLVILLLALPPMLTFWQDRLLTVFAAPFGAGG